MRFSILLESLSFGVLRVWRAFFLAIGIMLVILGIECLLIDSATLAAGQDETIRIQQGWFAAQEIISSSNIVRPPEWIPWSFIASGAVVLLYAYTLPKRWGGGEG